MDFFKRLMKWVLSDGFSGSFRGNVIGGVLTMWSAWKSYWRISLQMLCSLGLL